MFDYKQRNYQRRSKTAVDAQKVCIFLSQDTAAGCKLLYLQSVIDP